MYRYSLNIIIEYVYHIVSLKPLNIANCQFKKLRENTLLTNRIKETHARRLPKNPFRRGSDVQIVVNKNIKEVDIKQLVSQRDIKNIINEVKFSDPTKQLTTTKIVNPIKEDEKLDLVPGKSCTLERIPNKPWADQLLRERLESKVLIKRSKTLDLEKLS